MANVFGMYYDPVTGKESQKCTFDIEYIPKAQRDPRTPIHAMEFEKTRNKLSTKRKKQQAKEERHRKKQFIENGCGHSSILDFVSSPEGTDIGPVPVTEEKKKSNVTMNLNDDVQSSEDVQCSTTSSFDVSSDSVAKTTSSGEVEASVENGDDVLVEDGDIPSDFVCPACGNNREECHESSFGSHLVHEVITFFEERQPDMVTDLQIKHHFEYMYNIHLKMCCQDITQKYDTRNWYDMPRCLEKGAFAYALKLVHNQQIYYQIKKNRVEGIAGKELFNRAKKDDSKDKCDDSKDKCDDM